MEYPDREMTAQEIVDYVNAFLLKQGKQSKSGNKCAYRSSAGACAVGCLISDELAQAWDKLDASVIHEVPPDTIPDRLLPHLELLTDLQSAHDRANKLNFPDDWKLRLAGVCRDRNLKDPNDVFPL